MCVSLTYPFNIVQHTLSHIVEHRKLDSLATPDNIVGSTVTSCWTNNVRQFDPSLSYEFKWNKNLLGTGHKVQGGGPAEIGGGSSIFKLTKRGGSPKYWSCL